MSGDLGGNRNGCIFKKTIQTLAYSNQGQSRYTDLYKPEQIRKGGLPTAGSPLLCYVLWTFRLIYASQLQQFLGGSAIIIIIGTPVGAIAASLGFNPAPVIMGITLGASFGFCTFIAGVCIGLSTAAGYRFNDYTRYNWQPSLISFCCIMLIPFLCPF